MRVTNLMLMQSTLQGMRARLRDMAVAQRQASTLKRVNEMSDDPIAGAEISRIDSTLRDVEQFRRNATSARTRLSTEDVVLTSMRKLLTQAREVATEVGSYSPVDPARQRAVSQLNDIMEQLVSLGNTKVGDEYLFGGSQTSTPPFQPDGTYTGDSAVRTVELDEGTYIDTVHAGDHSLGGAMLSLTSLQNSVATETAPEIAISVANLQTFDTQLLADQAEVGARLQTIGGAESRLTSRVTLSLDRRDALAAVDPAEALVTMQAAQTALERAYAVVGKIMQTSLLDFLK